jgi:hypothetical protein
VLSLIEPLSMVHSFTYEARSSGRGGAEPTKQRRRLWAWRFCRPAARFAARSRWLTGSCPGDGARKPICWRLTNPVVCPAFHDDCAASNPTDNLPIAVAPHTQRISPGVGTGSGQGPAAGPQRPATFPRRSRGPRRRRARWCPGTDTAACCGRVLRPRVVPRPVARRGAARACGRWRSCYWSQRASSTLSAARVRYWVWMTRRGVDVSRDDQAAGAGRPSVFGSRRCLRTSDDTPGAPVVVHRPCRSVICGSADGRPDAAPLGYPVLPDSTGGGRHRVVVVRFGRTTQVWKRGVGYAGLRNVWRQLHSVPIGG